MIMEKFANACMEPSVVSIAGVRVCLELVWKYLPAPSHMIHRTLGCDTSSGFCCPVPRARET